MMWLEGRVCGLCWTALMSKYEIYIASGLMLQGYQSLAGFPWRYGTFASH